MAQKHGIVTIIDNTFCTPYLQQPFLFGIDFVIHSATKYLNGHGNSLAGVILGRNNAHKAAVKTTLKLMGGTCNAWDAWLLNNGLKTLALRMDAHCSNAMQLAVWLNAHPRVTKVNYIGLQDHTYHAIASKQMRAFGGMLSFMVDGSMEDTFEVINNLSLCTQAPTLGDVDTLILHPASSSHLNVDKDLRASFGITDNLVRVSVGIEDINDLIADFEQALK
ncbi:MAG: PLP-dependent transferase [Saprospiraceae bacterium]|nr:PLP-dependent transferase [Saprospiraceae bacterium]